MNEGTRLDPQRRLVWINRALVAAAVAALVAGLLMSHWRVVLRYAELL